MHAGARVCVYACYCAFAAVAAEDEFDINAVSSYVAVARNIKINTDVFRVRGLRGRAMFSKIKVSRQQILFSIFTLQVIKKMII